MWESQSKVNVITNSNQFSEFLSHQLINRYVENKNRLNSYNLCVTDGEKKIDATKPLKFESCIIKSAVKHYFCYIFIDLK